MAPPDFPSTLTGKVVARTPHPRGISHICKINTISIYKKYN